MKLNQTATKGYALRCSEALRAGKFTRVGDDFIQSVLADLETAIRQLGGPAVDRMPDLQEGETFLVWSEVEPAVKEKLEALVRGLIVRKVLRHPTVGCTLKAP